MTAPTATYPASVADLVDDFKLWAAELGTTPSANATRKRFRIGNDKANALLATLTAPAPDERLTSGPATQPPAEPTGPAPVPEVTAAPVAVEPSPLAVVDVDPGPEIGPAPIPPPAPAAPVVAEAGGQVDGWPVDEVAAKLDSERARLSVKREDTLARRAMEAEHRIAMGDVREQARAAKRARGERARDAADAAALSALYRRAQRSGTRARLRAQIQGSAEMRALRVARVRSVILAAGVPLLAAFAAWSTTGVQAGVVKLLNLDSGSAGWWAAWAMEPALIAIVGLIIIGRAMLRSAGGDTDARALIIEWSALFTSLALNIIGGWDSSLPQDQQYGPMLAHSVGPIGAATVAFLIGLFDGYVSAARPWHGAPKLAEMDLDMAAVMGTRPDAINRPEHPRAHLLPGDVRTLLDDTRAAVADGTLTAEPSAYAIHKHVMGGRGDKAKASRVAALLAHQAA
ncbi:hypothetical protein [Catellatospora citrea]|uniref:Uncharacterized protein n=1 Tax=Catellatospora citrea TaxID=53366 RepID=A0A8J3KU02_9ACTN|nr:hypothetical protein [Catellatospora citrea]RKE08368.1 hypothetical protein C8E86_3218 [Catellatospora citrea]GIG03156.1 hypothetical protein Cci01nite_82490 [Catellatospora citrea]